jgi:hypothetical protein
MSPPAPNPSSDDIQAVAKDGVIAGALGSAAMVARLLLSTEPVTFGWVVRRVFAAAITASFVGWAVSEHIQSVPLRFAATGASGYAAPEVLDYLLKYIKARGEAEVSKVKKGIRGKAKRKK